MYWYLWNIENMFKEQREIDNTIIVVENTFL